MAKTKEKRPKKQYDDKRTTVTSPATGACNGAITEGACDSTTGCSSCPASDEC